MIRDIKSIPVLRPFFGLVIGILAENWILIPFHWPLVFMILLFFFLFILLIFRIALKPRISWIPGIGVVLIFISAGFLVKKCFQLENKKIRDVSKTFWVGEVVTEPLVKNKLARFEMSLFFDSCLIEKCKVQVLMQTSNGFEVPHAGQIIALKTKPERIQGPMNPGEFDYAAYLESMHILYRCFVKEGEWKVLNSSKRVNLDLLALRVKNQLWAKIENLESENTNLGVLYAISLGSKDLLTPEIREAYAVTGAMHVLVVSGQHIALIWMVLSYIFIWVRDLPGGKYLQFFLITGLIWFYSFMTGITASVVRASGMFTLVSLGKIIQKESSIYNSLCISAFFGLLINPQWATDAGFQLSYIAVLSIVFFQPKISTLWEPRTWIVQKIWEISSVSIAAQIGTLPLTLFYFNRFPPWFILSNILVIPLVTLIMILFIIMLIFMMIPIIFSFLLKFILFLIGLMNTSLILIENLPTPGMNMIYLNGFQMLCFVLILLSITFFIRYKKNFLIFLGLVSLLFLASEGTLHRFNSSRQKEIILFSVQGKMILGLFEGCKGMILHNGNDTVDISGSINYKCKPYLLQNNIKELVITGLSDSLKVCPGFRKVPGNQNYFFRFSGKSIFILNDPMFYKSLRSDKFLNSDILIVKSQVPRLWKGQKPLFITGQLLISSATSRYSTFNSGETGVIKTDSIFDSRLLGAFRYSNFNNPVIKQD